MLRARRLRGSDPFDLSGFIRVRPRAELYPPSASAVEVPTNNRSIADMTGLILLGGPLFVVLGCLYWVLSLSKKQAVVNAEVWKRHGVKA
jgi:hypothetical protein